MWVNKTLNKAHDQSDSIKFKLIQIVDKNSVKCYIMEWIGTYIELNHDLTNENYLSFDINEKQL